MSMTIKDILKKKAEIEIEITDTLTKFQNEADIIVDHIRWNNFKWDSKTNKDVKVKPVALLNINIDNDPRTLD